ncbi:MAG TPA: SGNH/GDSL hydrolase family protein [Planctomycetota bacterium]
MLKLGVSLVVLLAAGASAATFDHDPSATAEFRSRDGLPNFFAKLQAGGPVRIAYVGGSITAAAGWRPKTMAWFKAQFPNANVIEINAAISGTGSDYSACRLHTDVLPQKPDLVFLECLVNGGGGYEQKSVEGVVRQVWKHNPQTDICFVYTIGQWMLKDLQAGKNVPFGRVMETIANAYGIPTIDLGVEIAKREKEGLLVFKSDVPIAGKLVFSADGVHPGDSGHDIYRDVIARSMLQMKGLGTAGAHTLPAAMEANCWETATLLPGDKVVRSAGWTPVDTEKDPVYTDDKGRTQAMMRGAFSASKAGETITVKWNGTSVGISDIPYGEPFILEAVVDGGAPIKAVRQKTMEKKKHSRFWYLPEQKPGDHTVVFTIKALPEGQSYYSGQVLIIGTPLP